MILICSGLLHHKIHCRIILKYRTNGQYYAIIKYHNNMYSAVFRDFSIRMCLGVKFHIFCTKLHLITVTFESLKLTRNVFIFNKIIFDVTLQKVKFVRTVKLLFCLGILQSTVNLCWYILKLFFILPLSYLCQHQPRIYFGYIHSFGD